MSSVKSRSPLPIQTSHISVSASAYATEKPLFIEALKTLEVSEGNSVCFTVNVAGYPTPQVTWYRNGVPILPGYSPYFEVFSNQAGDNQHSLRIREVFSEDAGRIVAKAENVAGSVSCSAELLVIATSELGISLPPASRVSSVSLESTKAFVKAPAFIKPLLDVKLVQGQKAVLECRLPPGSAPDRVHWLHDAAEIAVSSDCFTAPCIDGICTLTLLQVSSKDSGLYTCVATFGDTSSSTTMNLSVTGQGVSSPVTPVKETAAPVFQRLLSNRYLIQGQTTTFECQVTGQPPPEILWTRRGHPLVDKARYQSTYDQYTGLTTLTILGLKDEDEGEYMCKAFNSVGEVATSAFLLHQEHFSNWQQRTSLSSGTALQSSTSEQPRGINSQSSVSSKMAAPSEVTNHGYHHRTTVDTKTHLTIVDNEKKTWMSNGNATSPTDKDSSDILGLNKSAPKFEQKLANCILADGVDITFSCVVTGTPVPNIHWQHNGRLIRPSSRYEMRYAKTGECILQVKKATRDDVGSYSCCASNLVGRETCSAELFSDGIGNIDNTSYISSEALKRITSQRPESDSQSQSSDGAGVLELCLKPIFRKLPADIQISEGQTARLDSIVTGRPNPEMLWFRDGTAVYDDQFHKIVVNQDGISSLILMQATPKDTGTYRCVARNRGGEDSFTVNVQVQARQVQVAPRFVERPTAQTISEGASFTLIAEATGVPLPSFTWTRDSVVLTPGDSKKNHNIANEGGRSVLRIDRSIVENAGWYQCTAVSTAGSATSRAKVIVQADQQRATTPDWKRNLPRRLESPLQTDLSAVGDRRNSEPAKNVGDVVRPFARDLPKFASETRQSHVELTLSPTTQSPHKPLYSSERSLLSPGLEKILQTPVVVATRPTFDKVLQDLTVVENNSAKFMVKVSGEPCPTVAWSVNGVNIFSSARYQIGFDGLMHTLEIKKTRSYDSGTVEVSAKNNSGEAFSSATLIVNPASDLRSRLKQSTKSLTEIDQEKKNFADSRSSELDQALRKPKLSAGDWRGYEKGLLLNDDVRSKAAKVESSESVLSVAQVFPSQLGIEDTNGQLETLTAEISVLTKNKIVESEVESQSVHADASKAVSNSFEQFLVLELEGSSLAEVEELRAEDPIKDTVILPETTDSVISLSVATDTQEQFKPCTAETADEDIPELNVEHDVPQSETTVELSSAGLFPKKCLNAGEQPAPEINDSQFIGELAGIETETMLESDVPSETELAGQMNMVPSGTQEQNVTQDYNDSLEDCWLEVAEQCNASDVVGNFLSSEITGMKSSACQEQVDPNIDDSPLVSDIPELIDDKTVESDIPSETMSAVIGIELITEICDQKCNESWDDVEDEIAPIDVNSELSFSEVPNETLTAEKREEELIGCIERVTPDILENFDSELPTIEDDKLQESEVASELLMPSGNDQVNVMVPDQFLMSSEEDPVEVIDAQFVEDGVSSIDVPFDSLTATTLARPSTDTCEQFILTAELPPVTDLPSVETVTADCADVKDITDTATAELCEPVVISELHVDDSVDFVMETAPAKPVEETAMPPLAVMTVDEATTAVPPLAGIASDEEPTVPPQFSNTADITVEKKMTAEVTETVTVRVSAEGSESNRGETPNAVTRLKSQIVDEGQVAIMECQFAAEPKLQIVWNKDGELLIEDDQIQIETMVDGPTVWSRLTIYDVQVTDAGKYGVTVKNSVSDMSMTASLVVNEVSRSTDLRAGLRKMGMNYVDRPPMEDIIEEEEKSLRVVESPPDVAVNRDSAHDDTIKVELAEDHKEEQNMTTETATSQMFSSTEQRSMPDIVRSLSATSLSDDQSSITESLTVELGQPIKLGCLVRSAAESDITWLRNRIRLNDARCITSLNADGEAALFIAESSVGDAGTYSIRVGSSTSDIKVNVIFSKPTFVIQLTNQEVRLGHPVTFSASVSGVPKPEISWRFGGKPVDDEAGRYQLESNSESSSLTVISIAENDIGAVCECRAWSASGESVSSAAVLPAADPPVIIKALESCAACEQGPAEFQAQITGSPFSHLSWYLNEEELQESETVVIESSKKDNTFTLTFFGNIKDCVGTVRLVAGNSGGEVVSEASLTISGRPPTFIEKPYTSQVLPGQTALFCCHVDGEPLPIANWSKGKYRSLTADERTRISTDGRGQHTLEIDDVKRADAGVYTVTFANQFGSVSCPVSLAVECPETIDPDWRSKLEEIMYASLDDVKLEMEVEGEDKSTVTKTSSQSIAVSDAAPKTEYFFTKELNSIDTFVGHSVTLECRVSKEDDSVRWLKSGEPIANSKKHKITNVGVTLTLEINDVTFDDEAEYQCCCHDAVTSCMVFVEELRVRPVPDASLVEEPVPDVLSAEKPAVIPTTGVEQDVQTVEKTEEKLELATETAVDSCEEKIDVAEVMTSSVVEVAEVMTSSVVEETELSSVVKSLEESQVSVVEMERTELSVATPVELQESVVELEKLQQVSTLVKHAEMAMSSDDVFSESLDKQCSELSLDAAVLQSHREHKTSSILSTDEYESSMALSCCQSELSLSSGSSKPCFIRKLPSRVEITEGQSFSLHCRTSGAGCKPWFIKKLPTRIDVERGKRVDLECTIGNWSDDFLEFSASSSVRSLDRKKKMSSRGTKPLSPSALYVTYIGASSAVIEWEKPYSNGGAPITHYILEKRESGMVNWQLLTNLPPDIMDCELDNMSCDKVYYVRVRAANRHGPSDPCDLNEPIRVKGEKKDVPSEPGCPQVVSQSEHGLVLIWDQPVCDGGCPVLHYLVEMREMRGPRWARVQKTIVAAPPHTVLGLTDGSQYQFCVYACNVLGVGAVSPMSKIVSCKDSDMSPAKFISQIQDVTVEEGQKATFECTVVGSPVPLVTWFKNRREVFDGYKHRIQQEHGRVAEASPSHAVDGSERPDSIDSEAIHYITCRLVVFNVTLDDSGEIECRTHNSGGMDASRAQLNVHSPAQVRLSQNIFDGVTSNEGDELKLAVPVVGQPSPNVTWMKDGDVILPESDTRQMWEEDGQAFLLISKCRRADRGEYAIYVENYLGGDEAVFSVEINARPNPPAGKPKFSDVMSTSCQLEWNQPDDDGGSPVTSYIVEQLEVASNDVDGEWRHLAIVHVRHMMVRGLVTGAKYRFRVAAENYYGTSDMGEESEILTPVLSADSDASSGMNYDALVMSDTTTAHIRIDVEKMKSEVDLHRRYIICEELGRGAYGVLHRAIERATGRNWVAKFVACTAIERAMVRQEIELRNDLRHPCLLQLHEAFEIHGEFAFIVELVSGKDLLSRAVSMDMFTEAVCISWMRQVCQGVAHMHKNNFIHLDLRPENVLCVTSKSLDVKVAEFGIAQRVDPNRTVRVLFNTIEYCSPEVLTFAPISYSTDMWSLGVLAYVLLSGTSPFLGRSTDETYLNITQAAGAGTSSPHWDLISELGKDWISKLLVKESARRMTISEAMAHPWLNGEAESTITRIPLPVDGLKSMMHRQSWRAKCDDKLPIGFLAHEGAVFLKLSQEGIEMERELFMELPDQAPQVVVELSNSEAYEGTVGRFKCKFQGQPEPQIKWYHEGEEIERSNQKYNFWHKHGLAMLNILAVDIDDAGQYACVATNRLGSCTTVGELNIQELLSKQSAGEFRRRRSLSYDRQSVPPEPRRSQSIERQTSIERFTSTSSSVCGSVNESYSSGYGSCSAKIAPQFTLPLIDQTLPVGQKCILSVLIMSKADAEIAWFHGQTRFFPEESAFYRFDNENGWYRLVIDCLRAQDSGEWRCLATNSYGQCMSFCTLTVLDVLNEGHKRPEFTQALSRTIVIEGGPAKFECKVAGNPQPEIQWLKGRRPLGDDVTYEISCEENELYTLTITSAFSEHAGWFTCMATNAAGTSLSEAKLTVERVDCESLFSSTSFDRASLTDDLESVHTRTSHSSLRRTRPQLTSAPQFSARLRPKRCLVGQSVRFNCSISGIPEPSVTWSRADGTTIVAGKRVRLSNDYGLCSLEISSTRMEDSGLYIVRASNIEGQVSCSALLQVDLDNSCASDYKVKATASRESTPLCNEWLMSTTPIPFPEMMSDFSSSRDFLSPFQGSNIGSRTPVRDVEGAVTPEPLEFTDLIHFDKQAEIGISEFSSPIALIGGDGLANNERPRPTVKCDDLIQFETADVSPFVELVREASSSPFVGHILKSQVDSDTGRVFSRSTVTRRSETQELSSDRADDVIVVDGLLAEAAFDVDRTELTVSTISSATIVDHFPSEHEAKPCTPNIVVSCLVDVSDAGSSSVDVCVPRAAAGSQRDVAEWSGADRCVEEDAVHLESDSRIVVAQRSQETRAVSIPREIIPDLVFPEDGLESICWKRKEESAILRPTAGDRSRGTSAVFDGEAELAVVDGVMSSAGSVLACETQSQWTVEDVELTVEESESARGAIGAVETLSVADQVRYIDLPERCHLPGLFDQLLRDVTACVNSTAVFECVLRQAMNVTWYRHGVPIDTATSTGSKVDISTFDGGRCHRLTLRRVQSSDAGHYSVAATGDVGESADRESSAVLTIVDSPAPDGTGVAGVARPPVDEDSTPVGAPNVQQTAADRTNNGRSDAIDHQASPSSDSNGPSDSVTTDVTDDILRNDVTAGGSGQLQAGVVKQLLDISGTLTRFLTMEYLSDGGALTQAFRSSRSGGYQ